MLLTAASLVGVPVTAVAQDTTREGVIEQQQAEKDQKLTPPTPNRGERAAAKFEEFLTGGGSTWYPFFSSAAQGGGFTLGGGYRTYVSPYNTIAFQGSYTLLGYQRAEVLFHAPRLFKRRGKLDAIVGWRDATQVGFYGIGMEAAKSKETRVNYGVELPHASALLTLWPTRRHLLLQGGLELARWRIRPGEPGRDNSPSIETVYPPSVLPGVNDTADYVHTQGTAGFDWRPAAGYARRGGYYGITVHDYTDREDKFGFERVDYDLIQHLPILREAWVISLHSRVSTTFDKSNEAVPFYLLPTLGGGSTLRGYSSYRYRDRHSLLLQAEWRIMANRFLDSAVFYDAGKVASDTSDLDFNGLKSDVGFGVRFHSPYATSLRIDVAKGQEGFRVVFGMSEVF